MELKGKIKCIKQNSNKLILRFDFADTIEVNKQEFAIANSNSNQLEKISINADFIATNNINLSLFIDRWLLVTFSSNAGVYTITELSWLVD